MARSAGAKPDVSRQTRGLRRARGDGRTKAEQTCGESAIVLGLSGVQCGRSVEGYQYQCTCFPNSPSRPAPLMTMDCSPHPGTAAALDRPPCDVAVYCPDPFTFLTLPTEFVSLIDNLRRAGLRVENDGFAHLETFSRDPTPARVNLIIVSKRWVSAFHHWCAWTSFATVMRSGEPVIPVYLDGGPHEMHDQLERSGCHLLPHYLPIGPNWNEDANRRFLTISGHDLARYDGNKDELKMGVLCEVSKVVNTHHIAEANELISQNHIYKRRVSVSEEKARRAAELAVSYLKLLAGELLKHAMDNVVGPSSHTAAHFGPSSRFRFRAHYREVRRVAARLSMKPYEFAREADRCIDDRNEVAHFLADKDWRKHCADAVEFINRYPDVKTFIPVQCGIILAHEVICDEFGL